ncbi:MAG: FIST C-terminal domain-containing protein [Candidatus Saccharibacteria bacterium]|nr:FIST C-terminal domain-containing protein [Pseudorhodobacter sp.]
MLQQFDLNDKASQAVRIGVSHSRDAVVALADVAAQIMPPAPSFVLLFVPDTLDPVAVAEALPTALPRVVVFGCTTAGQITPHGYDDKALVALAFQRDHFRIASRLFKPLAPVSIAEVVAQTQQLSARFPVSPGRRQLALIFVDGLSKQEDILVAALEVGLKEIPVFGGSAGDGLAFVRTQVLHGGEFHTNAAVLLLLDTDLNFCGLGFDHFEPTGTRMVVTRAVPEERLVLEINGSPAAQEYARLVNIPVSELSPLIFAENPVLVRNRNLFHVRAIQEIYQGVGLTFLSAIDDGLLLTLGRGKEIISTLDAGLTVADAHGDAPDFILGFDCVLRKLEIEHKGLSNQASERFRKRRVVGFSTYGEQHLGVHVNQTFVGVAFFRPTGNVAL